jgi:hypothetical protein
MANPVIVVGLSPGAVRHLATALDHHLRILGPAAPADLVALADGIRKHLQALGRSPLASGSNVPHDGLVSYRQAADALGCSTSTIGRHVTAGRLERVGRRITLASLHRLIGA